MKINSTIVLGFILLVTMLGAGAASAFLGFKMGHEALKGVSQPEVNPTKKLADKPENSANLQEFKPLDEKKIVAKVQAYINRQSITVKPDSGKDSGKKADKKTAVQPSPSASPSSASLTASLPLKVQDQGVSLEVVKVSQQGGFLLLSVNLKNEGSKSFQFLYSFLEIKDNQGHGLSVTTEGLPEDLPANRENFAGVIKVPVNLVNNQESLSLNLTDYPDQTLKLNLTNIPTNIALTQ